MKTFWKWKDGRRQKKHNIAKASITQMRELSQRQQQLRDEDLLSDADTTAKQTEDQEATNQSMLCHERDRLMCHIAEYEPTAECMFVCVHVEGTATLYSAKVCPTCHCQC